MWAFVTNKELEEKKNKIKNSLTSTWAGSTVFSLSNSSDVNPALEEAKAKIKANNEAKNISSSIKSWDFWSEIQDEGKKAYANVIQSNIDKLTESWTSKEEAMLKVALADNQINTDSAFPNFSQNVNLWLAVDWANSAYGDYQWASKNYQSYMWKLRNSWDTNVKTSLDTLYKLWQDQNYMQFLWALGLSPEKMISLRKWRDGFVSDYADEIRKNFNNDVLRLENLDKIKKEAENEYRNKVKVLNYEIERISKNNDEIIEKGYDENGELVVARVDSNTGNIYYEKPTWPYSIVNSQKSSNVFSKYNTSWTPNSTEQIIATIWQFQWGESLKRWQCGEFVNDVVWIPSLFKDSKESKYSVINAENPVVWWAFVSNIWEYGHVWIIQSINEDWTLNVVDSNRFGDEKVTVRTINPQDEGVVWYFDPWKLASWFSTNDVVNAEKDKNTILAEVPTEYKKAIEEEYDLRVKAWEDPNGVLSEIQSRYSDILKTSSSWNQSYDDVLKDYSDKISWLTASNAWDWVEEIYREIKKTYPSKSGEGIFDDILEMLSDEVYEAYFKQDDIEFISDLKSSAQILNEVQIMLPDYSSEEMAEVLLKAWVFDNENFQQWIFFDDNNFNELESILNIDWFNLANWLSKNK